MKVIGFDSWTGGVQNYQRIAREFEARGWEFRVVHIGSWGGDARPAPVEMIDGVAYHDIVAYDRKRLDDVLEQERPDAVVFLSVDTFAHRAFNRLAARRGIPTLHLYHGLVNVQEVAAVRHYKVNLLAQTRFVLERIPKALRRTWPAYAGAMLKTGAAPSDWVRFASDILVMASGRRPQEAAHDARTTRCCVYTAADVPHAMQRYGFAAADVVPVGNPDLQHFGFADGDAGSHLRRAADGGEVMYIDTGLVYTGFVFESRARFVQHLLDTRDALARQGLALVFKPHPDHLRSGMMETLAAAGVVACTREEFMPRLRRSRAAIVEPSTLSIVPALMGMPLLLAQHGPLAGQRYGTVLTSYPRHRMLQDPAQCRELIESVEAQGDPAAAQAWIELNAGPLPAAAMPQRVAQVIEHMARQAQGPRAVSAVAWRPAGE